MPLGYCLQKAACPAFLESGSLLVCPEKQIQEVALWKGCGLQILEGSAEEIWSLGQLEWEGPSETHFRDGDSSLHMALAHHLDQETIDICLWLSLLNIQARGWDALCTC